MHTSMLNHLTYSSLHTSGFRDEGFQALSPASPRSTVIHKPSMPLSTWTAFAPFTPKSRHVQSFQTRKTDAATFPWTRPTPGWPGLMETPGAVRWSPLIVQSFQRSYTSLERVHHKSVRTLLRLISLSLSSVSAFHPSALYRSPYISYLMRHITLHYIFKLYQNYNISLSILLRSPQ